MRKLGMLALLAMVTVALVGCGGGLSEEKVKKVYSEAYDKAFEASKKGETYDQNKLFEEAAKANGFKDYKDFTTQGAKWDATKFSAASTAAANEFTEKVKKYNEEKAKGGGEEKKEEKKE
jgi:hypothetical protein